MSFPIGDFMKLRVRAIQQSTGVFQHVTIYDADLELTDGDVQVEISRVEVASSSPMSADPDDVEAARQAILLGAKDILEPRGLGANIRVERMVLHPVDFQPHQFRRHTAIELAKLVETRSSSND